MKAIRKLLVVGTVVSFLVLAIPGSYFLFSTAFANNFATSDKVSVEYRVTSNEADLSTMVDFKAGVDMLTSQQVSLPWSSKVTKSLGKGEPIALYFATYANKPTSITCEIYVNGVKVASQTEDGEDFISNNISYNYNK